jgi:microcystin-dependent protein
MSSPYLGEIRIFSFNFAPSGWAMCNGQTLPINQYAALFSLVGTTYGGNGTTTFQLPNMQGAVPVSTGPSNVLGAIGGEANHTLVTNEMPTHSHTMQGVVTPAANERSAIGNLPGAPTSDLYNTGGTTAAFASSAVVPFGSGQAHNNIQPSLVLNFCIALVGIYPTRS